MDDGWCGVCRDTTDGYCAHMDDGTTVPDAAAEITRLRNVNERQRRGKLPGIAHVAEIERLDDELKKAIDEIERLRGVMQDLADDIPLACFDTVDILRDALDRSALICYGGCGG